MKKLVTDCPQSNTETALNLFYIKANETWVRGYGPAGDDVSLFDLTRFITKAHIPDADLPTDNDNLAMMMPEWLCDSPDTAEGVIALLYTAAWAYAELRHRLATYENTGLEPEEVETMRESKADAQFMLTELCRLCDYDRLEELAKAEQEARLVVLPCKVGDTVHVDKRTLPYNYLHPADGCWDFARCEVVSIVTTKKETYLKLRALYPSRAGRRDYLRYGVGAIGKTVFLTREEAKAALLAQQGSGK